MNAEKYFQKAQRLEQGQSQLDPVHYGELVIEGCYMAAHPYIEAGAEWRGIPHPQAHAHKDNTRLLKQARAPDAIQDAWRTLETLRPGGIYGKEPDKSAGATAQAALQIIKDWAEGARPHS